MTRMTYKKFYATLAKAGKFRLGGYQKDLRSVANDDCPVTAVARLLTGLTFLPSDYVKAAATIHMSRTMADYLAEAADSYYGRAAVPDDEKKIYEIRKCLLRAVGLNRRQ